jgi:hypothetical protein
MRNTFLIIVIGLVVGIGAYFAWQTTHEPLTLNTDLYPLYTAAQWGPVKTSTVEGAAGAEMQSQPIVNIINIAASSTPFTDYYKTKLTNAGWTPDMNREAGGPGAELTVYTKGNQFIIVSFTSVFHTKPKNAPEQCPCDLEFTLISGTAK